MKARIFTKNITIIISILLFNVFLASVYNFVRNLISGRIHRKFFSKNKEKSEKFYRKIIFVTKPV